MAALKFCCLPWRLGMGLGLILEHHNAFQWDLATWRAACHSAWRSVWLWPYTCFKVDKTNAYSCFISWQKASCYALVIFSANKTLLIVFYPIHKDGNCKCMVLRYCQFCALWKPDWTLLNGTKNGDNGVFPKWIRNSVISVNLCNLINHRSMSWALFEDHLCY